MKLCRFTAALAGLLTLLPTAAQTANEMPNRYPEATSWMAKGRFGVFMHYQYRLIDWINTCNAQGGVCTLDWPFDPKTGLLKDFAMEQLKRVGRAVNLHPGPLP